MDCLISSLKNKEDIIKKSKEKEHVKNYKIKVIRVLFLIISRWILPYKLGSNVSQPLKLLVLVKIDTVLMRSNTLNVEFVQGQLKTRNSAVSDAYFNLIGKKESQSVHCYEFK